MKDRVELLIDGADGHIEMPHEDGADELASAIGGTVESSQRAGVVEWEGSFSPAPGANGGWTVRSPRNAFIAIRRDFEGNLELSSISSHPVVFFKTRDEAVAEERKLFWLLVGKDVPK